MSGGAGFDITTGQIVTDVQRGLSFADLLRLYLLYGVAATDTDQQALAKVLTKATPFLAPVPWAPGLVLSAGPPANLMIYAGSIFITTTGHTTGSTFDASKFSLFISRASGLLTTSGLPANTTGQDSDFAVDPATGFVYRNTAGVWALSMTLTIAGRVTFPTRAAFWQSGYTAAAQVIITADEENDFFPTSSYFDGFWLRLEKVYDSFSPQSLFRKGERGIVVDPFDKSTMWQDRAFATPVTASGQPVSVILDKKPARPNVAAARRNLLYDTGNWRSASRLTTNISALTAQMDAPRPYPDSPLHKLLETTTNGAHLTYRTYAHAGGQFIYGLPVAPAERTKVRIFAGNSAADYADFDLAAGTVIASAGAMTGAILPLPNGCFLCTVTGTKAAGSIQLGVWHLDATGASSFAGDPAKGLLVGGDQLVAGASWGAYQAVGSNVAGYVGGNVLSCDTDAKRPTYVEDGALRALRFDGSAQTLWADAVDLLSPSTAAISTFVFAAKQTDASGAAKVPVSHGLGGFFGGVGGREIHFGNTTAGALGGGEGVNSAYQFANSTDSTLVPRAYVAIVEFNPLATAVADRIKIQINGVDQTLSQVAASGTMPAAAASAIATLSVGSRDHASAFAAMDLYGFLGINRQLTAAEKAQANSYYGVRTGVVVPGAFTSTFTPTAGQFADTGFTADAGGYFKTSPYARVIFDTSANFIRLNAQNDIYTAYPSFTELGVYVNGAFYASVPCGALGATTKVLQLPAGSKRVEVVNGGQSRPGASIVGTYVQSIDADGAITPVAPPTRATRILMYGDSILSGGNATVPTRYGHMMLVRTAAAALATPQSVGNESYGFRSLYDDASSGAAISAYVARIQAWNITRLNMEIGRNDFGLNKWSASAFGAGYGALLDALHTALPSLVVDVVSPITSSDQATANSFGNTLADYRTQCSTVAAARSSYVTFRDGSAILTTADLDDGVHPTNAGHAKYATAERGWLGI